MTVQYDQDCVEVEAFRQKQVNLPHIFDDDQTMTIHTGSRKR